MDPASTSHPGVGTAASAPLQMRPNSVEFCSVHCFYCLNHALLPFLPFDVEDIDSVHRLVTLTWEGLPYLLRDFRGDYNTNRRSVLYQGETFLFLFVSISPLLQVS